MMLMPLILAAAAAAAPTMPAQPASLAVAGATRSVFERDWVLMGWALKAFDHDRDAMLSPAEVMAAGNEFRTIADGDGDGRVSKYEYAKAREFILARY